MDGSNFKRATNMKLKNSFNLIKTFFELSLTYCSIFMLIVGPINNLYAAQATNPTPSKEADGWQQASGVLDQFLKMYGDYTQQQSQAKAQAAQLLQQQQQMQQLTVKPVPSKYFPQCMLAPYSPTVHNVCEDIKDPNSLAVAEAYQRLAQTNIDIYEKLQRENGNSKIAQFNTGTAAISNSGITCLKQNKALVDSQLQEKMNLLEDYAAKAKKNNQAFRDINKPLLNQLTEINNELNGGGDSIDAKNRDFSKLLKGSGCEEILPSDTLKGASKGLRGIAEFMDTPRGKNKKSLRSQAVFLIQDEGKIKKQLDNQIFRINDIVKENGIEGLNKRYSSISRGMIKFGPMDEIVRDKTQEHLNNYESLVKEFAEIKDSKGNPIYTVPPLDRNFNQRISEVNAKNLIKNTLIEDCITFNGDINIDEILENLRHDRLGNKGSTIVHYRDELNKILYSRSALESDNYIQEKLDAIKKVDDHYGRGEITIKLNSSYWGNNAGHPYTAYELFANIYKQCELKYENGEIESGKKSEIENALKRLNDFAREERTFTADLGQEIADEILNCNSTGGESMGGTCSEESLQPENKNFCLKTGVSCAQTVNQCYQRVDNEIQTRVKQMKTIAVQYNRNVEEFIKNQEAFYTQLKREFAFDSGLLKQFFEGANFNLGPEDKLFIELPGFEEDKETGVQLRDKNMKFLNNLPEAIETLKQKLAEQQKEIDKKIDEHIADQQQVLERNIAEWSKVLDECTTAEKAYKRSVDEQNKKMAEDYQENQDKLQDFCTKYNMLRSSPVPICDGDNSASALMEESTDIAGQLDPALREDLPRRYAFCNQAQGESKNEGDEDEEISRPVELVICDPNESGKFNAADPKNNLLSYLEDMDIDVDDYKDIEIDSDEFEKLSKTEQRFVKSLKSALKGFEIQSDEDEDEDKNEKSDKTKDSATGSSFCQNVKEKYKTHFCEAQGKECKEDQDMSKFLRQQLYVEGQQLPSGSRNFNLAKLSSVAKKLKKSNKNQGWQRLGEQPVADCTANHSQKTDTKGIDFAMKDIMALKKGMSSGEDQ